MNIKFQLTPTEAAALKRFAEKVSHEQAGQVLYPHVHASIRESQAYQILKAFATLEKALAEAGATSWPWIENGTTT